MGELKQVKINAWVVLGNLLFDLRSRFGKIFPIRGRFLVGAFARARMRVRVRVLIITLEIDYFKVNIF